VLYGCVGLSTIPPGPTTNTVLDDVIWLYARSSKSIIANEWRDWNEGVPHHVSAFRKHILITKVGIKTLLDVFYVAIGKQAQIDYMPRPITRQIAFRLCIEAQYLGLRVLLRGAKFSTYTSFRHIPNSGDERVLCLSCK
jgi:hypothetical protein